MIDMGVSRLAWSRSPVRGSPMRDDQLGQGREKVRQFLKDNPAITEEIENKVKAEFGLIGSADQFAEDGEAAAAAAVSEAAAADVAKDSKAAAAPAAKTTRAKAGTAKA